MTKLSTFADSSIKQSSWESSEMAHLVAWIIISAQVKVCLSSSGHQVEFNCRRIATWAERMDETFEDGDVVCVDSIFALESRNKLKVDAWHANYVHLANIYDRKKAG